MPAAPAPAAEPAQAPPPPPQYTTPPEPPPPAQYPPLGGKPEPEVEKGDWDPWDHVGESKHDHDGFLLRLAIGFGMGGVGGDDTGDLGQEVSLSGIGLNFDVAIGGALTDNLVLNADLFQATVFNPSVELDGDDIGDADDLDQDVGVGEDTELTGIGIGVTYYIMPVNIYLAGSVGIGKVIFVDNSGDRSGSDVGFAADLLVGKEWWVGADWGIGLAGQLILIAAQDDVLGDVGGLDFGVLFTATYN